MNIMNLLRNPVKEMERNSKLGVNEGVLASIYASVLLSVVATYNFAVASYIRQSMLNLLKYGIGVFSLAFLSILFIAYLLNLFVDLMGGKGKYKDGLLSIGYTASLFTTGLFLNLVLGLVPQIGAILSLIISTLFAVASYGLFLMSIHKLYKVEFLVAVVTSVVLVYTEIYFFTQLVGLTS